MHLAGMKSMGVDISLDEGYTLGRCAEVVEGGEFNLAPSSVGATVNLVIAAVRRAERFVIHNAAIEPDVVQLCQFLVMMGADIEGIGTKKLTIHRVAKLTGCEFVNQPDRIEAGTYMIAATMNPQSALEIAGCNPAQLSSVVAAIRGTGAEVDVTETSIKVQGAPKLNPVSIKTGVYPGFPTDLQAQWAAMLTQAPGASAIDDTVYGDRISYVPELVRLGAEMQQRTSCVTITGGVRLTGASVMSTDLRGSVSLVLAAMVADGPATISRIYHLDRGDENLEKKLGTVGAKGRGLVGG